MDQFHPYLPMPSILHFAFCILHFLHSITPLLRHSAEVSVFRGPKPPGFHFAFALEPRHNSHSSWNIT